MNCSIASNGGDISKATAAWTASLGILSRAVVVVTRPRANSADVKRFMRALL